MVVDMELKVQLRRKGQILLVALFNNELFVNLGRTIS